MVKIKTILGSFEGYPLDSPWVWVLFGTFLASNNAIPCLFQGKVSKSNEE